MLRKKNNNRKVKLNHHHCRELHARSGATRIAGIKGDFVGTLIHLQPRLYKLLVASSDSTIKFFIVREGISWRAGDLVQHNCRHPPDFGDTPEYSKHQTC